MSGDGPLAEELPAYAQMSGLLLSEETAQSALRLVMRLAEETIAGAVGAGVTLIDSRGDKITASASDPLVEEADRFQYELDEGPCLSAWASRSTYRIDDLPDERWPRWSAALEEFGLRAAVTTPMIVGDVALGAIKVYAEQPGAFDERDERLLAMFAAQVAVLVANVQFVENAQRLSERLKGTLRARQVIGQAMGILMAPGGIDEEAAFAHLISVAERDNRELLQAAQLLIQSAIDRER